MRIKFLCILCVLIITETSCQKPRQNKRRRNRPKRLEDVHPEFIDKIGYVDDIAIHVKTEETISCGKLVCRIPDECIIEKYINKSNATQLIRNETCISESMKIVSQVILYENKPKNWPRHEVRVFATKYGTIVDTYSFTTNSSSKYPEYVHRFLIVALFATVGFRFRKLIEQIY